MDYFKSLPLSQVFFQTKWLSHQEILLLYDQSYFIANMASSNGDVVLIKCCIDEAACFSVLMLTLYEALASNSDARIYKTDPSVWLNKK